MRTPTLTVLLLLAALILLPQVSAAAEHPDGPTESTSGRSGSARGTGDASTADLVAGINDYVDEVSRMSGGYFMFYDDVDKQPLALELVSIHDDPTAYLDENGDTAFFCADFRNTDGTMYDLDFILDTTNEEFRPIEVVIHKKDGVERYSWSEDEGVWSRQPRG